MEPPKTSGDWLIASFVVVSGVDSSGVQTSGVYKQQLDQHISNIDLPLEDIKIVLPDGTQQTAKEGPEMSTGEYIKKYWGVDALEANDPRKKIIIALQIAGVLVSIGLAVYWIRSAKQ